MQTRFRTSSCRILRLFESSSGVTSNHEGNPSICHKGIEQCCIMWFAFLPVRPCQTIQLLFFSYKSPNAYEASGWKTIILLDISLQSSFLVRLFFRKKWDLMSLWKLWCQTLAMCSTGISEAMRGLVFALNLQIINPAIWIVCIEALMLLFPPCRFLFHSPRSFSRASLTWIIWMQLVIHSKIRECSGSQLVRTAQRTWSKSIWHRQAHILWG